MDEQQDIRQMLSDMAIKDMLAEIDADCIRRWQAGQRIINGEWVYPSEEQKKFLDPLV